MSDEIRMIRPRLKAHDTHHPTSFIYADEPIEIPGYGLANVSFHFETDNSFNEMQELIKELQRRGFWMRITKEPEG